MMSELKIIDTVKRSFDLLKKDPTLIVLFILPALFPIERIIANYLQYLIFSAFVVVPEIPPMPPVHFVILYFIVGFLSGVWASAGAILKVTELEKESKLGVKEALSRGLKKAPKLLVPAIVSLAIYSLMVSAPTIAINYYVVMNIDSPAQSVGPAFIVALIAIGVLFIFVFYVAIRLRIAAPACVSEDNFGLITSWNLVKGNWWKVFVIFLIFGVMSALISQIPKLGIYVRGVVVEPLSITAATLIYLQLAGAKPRQEEEGEIHQLSP